MWDRGNKSFGTERQSQTSSGFDTAAKLYFLPHADSKLYSDTEVYCTHCPVQRSTELINMAEESSNLLLPKAPILGRTDQILTLVILPTTFFFLRWYHTIHRQDSIFCIKIVYYGFILWARHWHLALFCKMYYLSFLHVRRLLRYICLSQDLRRAGAPGLQHKTSIHILPRLYSSFMNLSSQRNPLLLPLHHTINIYLLHVGQKQTPVLASD